MLEAKNLCKEYKLKKGPVTKALDNVSVKFADKGMVFILGKSGSGKSTLLNILGGLDVADSGEIIVKGKSSKDFKQSDFDSYRNTFIGFVFQEYNILDEFTISKNIGLALELQGKKSDKEAIDNLIEQVDLKGYGNRKPNTLSGGQKQRVAIARALVKEPEIIMADEPTGALDSNTGKQVLDTLKKLSKTKLVIVVSHDRDFAELYGDRIIELADGKIISDISKYKAAPKLENGLNVVDDKIITIKKGEKLDASKLKQLFKFINSSEDDVIVSIDKENNKEFKKIAKIDDNGNKDSFKKTDKISAPNYDPKELKLIKSKFPSKDALKMGASGLKSKPIRLFFTILLSAIAFCLFGLADTMASYDKVDNAIKSMQDSKINYATFEKNIVVDDDHRVDNKALLSQKEIDNIQKEFTDLNFVPVFRLDNEYENYSFGDYIFNKNSNIQIADYNTFYISNLSGFAEIDESNKDYIGDLYGSIPLKKDEIVLTEYTYEMFNIGSYNDNGVKVAINSKDDLIGKKISFFNDKEKSYTIVGIIDTHLDSSKYEDFKTSNISNSNNSASYYQKMREIELILNKSFHKLGFLSKGYLDSLDYNDSDKIDITDLQYHFIGKLVYGYNQINHTIKLEDAILQNDIFWNDSKKTKLMDDEIIVNLNTICSNFIEVNGKLVDITIDNLFHKNEIYDNNSFEKAGIEGISLDEILKDKSNTEIQSLLNEYILRDEYYSPSIDEYDIMNNIIYPLEDMMINKINYYYNSSEYENLPIEQKIIFNKLWKLYYNEVLTKVNQYLPKEIYIYKGYSSEGKTNKMNIKGYYIDNPDRLKNDYVAISNQIIEDAKPLMNGKYLFMTSKLDYNNKNDITKMVNLNYTENHKVKYKLQNTVIQSLDYFNEMIERMSKIFLYVGIGFATFASLLLLNFITISISYKKREIGILRAIGARGMDVFKIFFNESFIIALINFILATLCSFIACYFINNSARNDFGLLITLLNIGVRQVLLMFIISTLVAFISSYLPVRSIAKKKPIEAIRNNE